MEFSLMKILYLTNIPSPYRVAYFNELGKMCDLTVVFERQASSERNRSWKEYKFEHFKGIFLKGLSTGASHSFCPDVIKHLKKNKFDHIIVTNFSDLTGISAISFMKLFGIPYKIESDGGFACGTSGMKAKLKSWMLSSAELCFGTADEHERYYKQYGVKQENIVRYPFTSLKNCDIASTPATYEEKIRLRKELGITEDKIVLSVGQFIYRKGFDVLLNAAKRFPIGTGTYIIGGVPGDELVSQKERLGLTNVHFVDFKQKEELKKWYRAADLFVLPTREDVWGLVINEAMAQGLPVITTNKCIAGLELVKNDENGRIVTVECADEIAKSVNEILADTDLMSSMSEKSLAIIKKYTIENMAMEHVRIWQDCLKKE